MSKLTKERVTEMLQESPMNLSEMEIRDIFSIFNLTLKEYYETSLNRDFKRFEVHFTRTWLFKVEIERQTPIVHVSNPYINFGDGVSGAAFPAKTLVELLRSVLMMAFQMVDPDKLLTLYFGDFPEYTEDEMKELVEVLNKIIADKP
jgi:hypothetical protein